MSSDRETSWGMGFELFARLFSEATAVRDAHAGGRLSDEEVANLASEARRAVRLWHDTRPADAQASTPRARTNDNGRTT